MSLVIGLGTVVVLLSAQSAAATQRRHSAVPSFISAFDSAHLTTLYSFQEGKDGGYPDAGVVVDASGNFYGTTQQGGGHDDGTVYRLTPQGKSYVEQVLYRFRSGTDGADPIGGVILGSGGTIFGTTDLAGGSGCGQGCGNVFELVPRGSAYKENVLYTFQGGADGGGPQAGLLAGSNGVLYGTTVFGGSTACGSGGCGVVFALTPSGSGYAESVVYAFQGGGDGHTPRSELIADAAGNLYGTTAGGGATGCTGFGCGTVFKLTHSGSSFTHTVLYVFQGAGDGGAPSGKLLIDSSGALYGNSSDGGDLACGFSNIGCGAVYKLTPSGSTYTESVLYAFQGGADGDFPAGNLTAGKKGALYGVTQVGGSLGDGTVFSLTPSGSTYTKTTLAMFDGSDGSTPVSGPIDYQGNLYGTTFLGGHMGNRCPSGGCGVVYRLKP